MSIPNLQTPNLFHFIFGLSLPKTHIVPGKEAVFTYDPIKSDKPFCLVHELAVRSAIEVNRPDGVIIWYDDYNMLRDNRYITRHSNIELRQIETPVSVLDPAEVKPPKEIKCVEHAADVLKLDIMSKYGGIYLDIDTLCVEEISHMINWNFPVMGCEGLSGLCNAVIISPPMSEFIERWKLQHYDSFNSDGWGEASVNLPYTLAKEAINHNTNICAMLSQHSFFWPDWSDHGLSLLFDFWPKGSKYNGKILHLWEAISWNKNHIGKITKYDIKHGKGLYHECARRFI